MAYLIAILAGLAFTISCILIARRWRIERELFGYGLLLGSLWYVGFGFYEGLSAASLLPQILAAVFFAAMAILGLTRSMVFIAAGWGTHIIWDYAGHYLGAMPGPWWTAPACLGFDPVVAAYLLARSRDWLPLKTQEA